MYMIGGYCCTVKGNGEAVHFGTNGGDIATHAPGKVPAPDDIYIELQFHAFVGHGTYVGEDGADEVRRRLYTVIVQHVFRLLIEVREATGYPTFQYGPLQTDIRSDVLFPSEVRVGILAGRLAYGIRVDRARAVDGMGRTSQEQCRCIGTHRV